jgi:hypothetical protein
MHRIKEARQASTGLDGRRHAAQRARTRIGMPRVWADRELFWVTIVRRKW